MADRLDKLERLQKRLRALANRLSPRDAALLQLAMEQLEHLEFVQGDVEDLADALAIIDDVHEEKALNFPDQVSRAELLSSIRALQEVEQFLMGRAPSHSIVRLEEALIQLAGGSRVALFEPQNLTGRPRDLPSIQTLKGILAGLMHLKQAAGMSREEAASWIADNMSPALASRITRKPITARTVEEWLDRYGGSHPPADAGGRAFKSWSVVEKRPSLTKRKLQEITERLAQTYPVRKR